MSLEVEGLSYAYPGTTRQIFSDFSMSLAQASSAAVVGPSGVGKSTLLALVGGLLRPDAGTVRVAGVPISTSRWRRHSSSRVGWVHQNLRSLSSRTAVDNVGVAVLAQGERRSRAEAVAVESLAAVGLAEFADRKAEQMSGGQLQRVCIARAIASRPRLLLADEPTGQLDSATSVTVIRAFLDAAAQFDATLLIATHDLEIVSMCDSVIRL